ncbi:hypothetical protein Mapa_012359 [Marchantia paleacea]|nr:hypothetical protein Mapa_012359 [Marchantia paleacea]
MSTDEQPGPGGDNMTVQVVAANGTVVHSHHMHVPKIAELKESLAHIHEMLRLKHKPALGPIRDIISREENKVRAPWRTKLGKALESTPFHVLIVILLLVDLLATAIDILKTVHSKSSDLDHCTALLEECQCLEHLEHSEHWKFLYWISISILSFLCLNVLGLLAAFGRSFFFHPGYVLDSVVVGTALGLEIGLDTDTAGLLIILTLWRIVRVAHGIFEVTDGHWEKEIKKLEEHIHESEAMHARDQERIAQLEGRKTD